MRVREFAVGVALIGCAVALASCTAAPRGARAPVQRSSSPATVTVPAENPADFVWSDGTGSSSADPRTVFTLLGAGFSRVHTSRDIDALIHAWIAKHPAAKFVRVVNFGSLMPDRMDSQRVWVWLVDGDSNLNLELVGAGACAKSAMAAPRRTRILVPFEEYQRFEDALPPLEQRAKSDKLGIWK
jgi:hypothetical protein